MTEHSANQFGGELAALQHQRQMEELPVSSGVENALDAFAAWASEAGIPGMGLFRRALKSGQTPVETLVAQLESAAYEEIRRIWEHLKGQEEKQKEFAERLKSQEAQTAYFSAVLHGLRTSDPQKQSRLATLTVISVYENDAGSEVIDQLMRSTVELKDADIRLLEEIYEMQSPFMRTEHWLSMQIGERWNLLSGYWQQYWDNNQVKYRGLEGERLMGSFARLESLGLIAPGPNRSSTSSPVAQCYLLLPDGMTFYERVHQFEYQR